jgi:hypothetical protein
MPVSLERAGHYHLQVPAIREYYDPGSSGGGSSGGFMPGMQNPELAVLNRPPPSASLLYGTLEAVLSMDAHGLIVSDVRFRELEDGVYFDGIRPGGKGPSLGEQLREYMNDRLWQGRTPSTERSTPDSLLEALMRQINPDGKLSDEDVGIIHAELTSRFQVTRENIPRIQVSSSGYTSRRGFTYDRFFFKVDRLERLRAEHRIYQFNLGEFEAFRPARESARLVEPSTGIGILVLDNLRDYPPGSEKLRARPDSAALEAASDEILYNIYLMGLFHKGISGYGGFGPLPYQGVHGASHMEETAIPWYSRWGREYQRFRETRVPLALINPVITDYHARQHEEASTIIHGDWKTPNLVNGHVVDYATVGIGYEIDELAYCLSDMRFNLGYEDMHHYLDTYVRFRSVHDSHFREVTKDGYGQLMHSLVAPALLAQLVVRHSVMNKRDMMDPEKYEQRQYYQHMIDEVLRGGGFV